MVLSQRLDLRQSQHLVLTPQLQQAIKLLQMSHMELSTFVAQEVEKNPLLEYSAQEPGRLGEGEAVSLVPATSEEGSPATLETAKQPLDQPLPVQEHDLNMSRGQGSDDETFNLVQNVAVGPNLREHLLSQIHMDFTVPAERIVASALVDLLDDAGYLPEDLKDIQDQLGLPETVLEDLIARLQRLDPPGVFARSLPECLAAQLRERNRLDPAMLMLLDHLDLLARRDYPALARLCGVDRDDLQDMVAEIRALDPKPAAAFTTSLAPPVTPDVLLKPRAGGGWHIELNSENLPRVLANEHYYTQILTGARGKEDKDFITEHWQQANWLVKALHQRATTMLKVATEIVRNQDQFFIHGIQFLKPLVLRDIAEAVEMHESTISRVTQNKYIATPRGLFELKYFFSTAIGTTGGTELVAAQAVKERVKALIDAEKPEAVLSDDKIVDLLRREGVEIARRTVAKYRDMLGIPSSAQRRREKKEAARQKKARGS